MTKAATIGMLAVLGVVVGFAIGSTTGNHTRIVTRTTTAPTRTITVTHNVVHTVYVPEHKRTGNTQPLPATPKATTARFPLATVYPHCPYGKHVVTRKEREENPNVGAGLSHCLRPDGAEETGVEERKAEERGEQREEPEAIPTAQEESEENE